MTSRTPTLSLRTNLLANFLGQPWRALMGFAFIPVYIRYLGVEAFGLVGVFSILQAWLGLVEMGMRPALGREMARYSAGGHDATSIRTLLRSVELLALSVALLIAVGIWAASGHIAKNWLRIESVAPAVAAQAVAVMGVVIALRLMENVYASGIVGLQRQVLHNVVTSCMATLRAVGAIGLLRWVSPSIEVYFMWQGLISLFTAGMLAVAIHRTLPPAAQPVQFSWVALHGIRRFAGGMMTITLLTLLLTQMDKILLTRLLPLKDFSYYSLAGVLVGMLFVITGPIGTAYLPRFTALITRSDALGLRVAYHQSAQLVTVLMGPAAVMLMMFGERLLRLWTNDSSLTMHLAPFVPVLALGAFLNCLMTTPYLMQLAHGWTRLIIQINLVAVVFLVPAIVVLVPLYGAVSAAWCGVILNAGYLIFNVQLMHQRLLRTERMSWYVNDIGLPFAAAAGMATVWWMLLPRDLPRLVEAILLAMCFCFCVLAALSVTPILREMVVPQVSAAWANLRTKAQFR